MIYTLQGVLSAVIVTGLTISGHFILALLYLFFILIGMAIEGFKNDN